MIGYGDEKNNFVLELTYNYGISKYRHGNDFHQICLSMNTSKEENVLVDSYAVLVSPKKIDSMSKSVFYFHLVRITCF